MSFHKICGLLILAVIMITLFSYSDPNRADNSDFTGFILDFEESQGWNEEKNTISAKAERGEYKITEDTIGIVVTNSTPNAGIWCFAYPGLEKKTDGKWEAVPMSKQVENAAYEESGWAFYTKQEWNSEDECFSVVFELKKEYLYTPWDAGEYRAVIFAEGGKIYAEFTITD